MISHVTLVVSAATAEATRAEADALLDRAFGPGGWDMRQAVVEVAEAVKVGRDEKGEPIMRIDAWRGSFVATPRAGAG